ncbi:MAG: glycine cleavage system aminomethyltransferase GcvT, partial [Oscillochloris sp.]|nr:glycine cleavage system aminomethyltransferase GcvT [Oscillochloris sp.]
AVRQGVGLFDISHMGRFMVRGPQAEEFLQYVATCDVSTIPLGQSNYGLLCRPDGGIVDDIFIYHLPDEYLVVVNASNREKDWQWLHDHAEDFDVEIVGRSDRWAMLAVQGPGAEALLVQAEETGAGSLGSMPFHEVALSALFGYTTLVARTGYTGEDGFELFFDTVHAEDLWDKLVALGAKPCGLGARDSLRFEPCLSLYGHEIGDEVNPYEARLGWVVKLDKGDFVGRQALAQIKAEGPARRLTGFEMVGKGIARGDYPVHAVGAGPTWQPGQQIGVVTTGMPSPTLGRPLGMAYVPTALSAEGSEFDIIIRGKPVRARAIKMPFYKPRYKK